MQAQPTVRVGVGVFICRNGKFLMGQRHNAHGEGSWSIPGGHMEFGESFEETAKREVREETGLEIINIRFAAVTNDFFPSEQKHYVTVWVISDCPDGRERITEPDKLTHFSWRTLDNLPAPLFLPWQQLLESPFISSIRTELESTSNTKPSV